MYLSKMPKERKTERKKERTERRKERICAGASPIVSAQSKARRTRMRVNPRPWSRPATPTSLQRSLASIAHAGLIQENHSQSRNEREDAVKK
jgi:hypothetical protein